MSLNKVMLIGHVGGEPTVRYMEGNSKVAQFALATTEKYRDRSGNLLENTQWHNVVCWRNMADIVEKYVKKGSQLYVEGKLKTRSWTTQSGEKRYSTDIVADNLQMLGQKRDAALEGARQMSQQKETASGLAPAVAAVADDEPTDDLPL